MNLNNHARLSVAPMMDWTDRHCRYFHRLLSADALLYTEMGTAAALVHGDAPALLAHDPAEHPVALQVGGSEPGLLAEAVRLGAAAGFAEINLNVGCPSDRVQAGAFGAALMKTPDLVEDCVAAMRDAAKAEITVKCRIGVDDQDPRDVLPDFLARMQRVGVTRVIVHARKAWLKGLSPKENREVPPLDYDLVRDMLMAFPELDLHINGGVQSIDEATGFLESGFAGVMIGRAAYQRPMILAEAQARIFNGSAPTAHEVIEAMVPYIEAHLDNGGRLHSVTRHMLGLFTGRPGARAWRRILSEGATKPGAGIPLLRQAQAAVQAEGNLQAAE